MKCQYSDIVIWPSNAHNIHVILMDTSSELINLKVLCRSYRLFVIPSLFLIFTMMIAIQYLVQFNTGDWKK